MKQEVRTVSSVVQDGKAYVYVLQSYIPVLEGKSVSKMAVVKLGDVEIPVIVERFNVLPQIKGNRVVWSMVVELRSQDMELNFLHGASPIIVFDCRDKVSKEEEENFIQVRWLA